MDADERDICMYLKTWPGQFVSAREICRRAGGKWRFREDAQWALPVLLRLAEKGTIEEDTNGHYRLPRGEQKVTTQKWVSPHIKNIIAQSGKNFTHVIENPDNLYDPTVTDNPAIL